MTGFGRGGRKTELKKSVATEDDGVPEGAQAEDEKKEKKN